jgi:hypothetical protein
MVDRVLLERILSDIKSNVKITKEWTMQSCMAFLKTIYPISICSSSGSSISLPITQYRKIYGCGMTAHAKAQRCFLKEQQSFLCELGVLA